MNPQNQIKALAELDGWKQQEVFESSFADSSKQVSAGTRWTKDDSLVYLRKLPDYLTSYDAIIPLIQKQDVETKRECYRRLHEHLWETDTTTTCRFTVDIGDFINFTPQQLCEALLRATGKWKE